jgi:hypothetical protein
MSTQNAVEETLVSVKQLANLPCLTTPCISLYLCGYSRRHGAVPFSAKIHSALEKVRCELGLQSLASGEKELLIRRLGDCVQDFEMEQRGGSLAVFCAGNFIQAFRTAYEIDDSVNIGNAFYIRPALAVLMHRRDFGILALSQKHTRLLRWTDGEVKAIAFPASIPSSVAEAVAFDAPDHDLEGRSSAGSSSAAMSRIRFGTSTLSERANAYIHDFFKLVDQEINQLLREARLPIVLAAVDRELALYRKVSTYPYLLQTSVPGSPDHLADSELLERAHEALDLQEAEDEARLLQEFSKKASRGLSMQDKSTILFAASTGQLHHILMNEQVSTTAEEEVLNLIALETIRHDGLVSTFSHRSLPEKRSIVAVLRYRKVDAGEGQNA